MLFKMQYNNALHLQTEHMYIYVSWKFVIALLNFIKIITSSSSSDKALAGTVRTVLRQPVHTVIHRALGY